MPASVDRFINALTSKGYSKSSAIAIGKSQGQISQAGRHLAAGPRAKRKVGIKRKKSKQSASGIKEAAENPLY